MNQYDHLKNKLHNYKVEIDKEKLWAITSHAIPQRKRRRAVLVMLFGALVVSAWLLHSTSLFPISERSLSNNENSGISGQLAQNLQDDTFENQEVPNKTIEVLSSKFSHTVAKLTEAVNPPAEEKFSMPVTVGKNTLFESNENQIEKAQILSERNPKVQNDNLIQIHSENEKENNATQKVHLAEFIIPEQTEESFDIIQETEIDFNNADPAIKLPVAYIFKDVQPIANPLNAMAAINSHKPNIKPLKARFLKSLQMVQGFGFSTVKIQSLTPESDQYAWQLEQKMRGLEVLFTTLSANLNLPVGFSLETGLQLSRLSTVIDHQWETNERIQEEGVTTIIIDEQGIPQSITDNRNVTRTTHYRAKRFTTHQNIDFVLALHKVIWKKQRLSMNAFVKGAYNLSYNAKGTMFDSNGSLVSFSKDQNPFRRNSPFDIGGGLQMMYQLHPHLSLTGNFTFDPLRYQFKNENLPVRFLHSGLSFGFGIGYVF